MTFFGAQQNPGAEKVLTAALHIIDPRSGKGPLAEHELCEEWQLDEVRL